MGTLELFRIIYWSQNDRCKNAQNAPNAPNAPEFFAVLAAQAQFLDALLKRSEEFLQLFVANFALQCLEARLSFRSRQCKECSAHASVFKSMARTGSFEEQIVLPHSKRNTRQVLFEM